MFGSSNPFGQSSSSPFGSQSVFGQTSSAAANPFAPKPFGSPNPFGAQTGGSIFGGTSTGVFGQPSTPAFGASSSPAFGSSTPAFGASSTPAFGNSSSSFGGSSLFGQKPAFGGFGSSPSQSSPFGSTFQQTQPAFGSNNVFGSTSPFGASSQPAFGASSTPAFGSTSTPAFGATSSPAFGATSTPAFGSTNTPAFGSTSTSIFGNTGASFGVSSSPAFGSTSFGTSTTVFGSSSTPAFGASTAPTFGSPTVPAFGASTTGSFSFGSTPSFGQSTSTFNTAFGGTSSPFGAQSSAFGPQTSTPAFGSPGFGQQPVGGQTGGTRIAPYAASPEVDAGSGTQPAGKLESISAMPQYKDKSHEELRWEDYQRGDKGGPNPAGQTAGGAGFSATQQNPFTTGTFGPSAANPFTASTTPNPFKPSGLVSSGFGSTSSIFNSSSGPFGPTTSTPIFGSSNSGFGSGSTPSMFGPTTSPTFNTPLFGSSLPSSSSSFGNALNIGNTQPVGLFQSPSPSFGQPSSGFGQHNSLFQPTTSGLGSTPFPSSNAFTGGFFSNSPSSTFPSSNGGGFAQPTPSQSPFQLTQPAQTSTVFPFPNVGQTSIAPPGGLGSGSSIFGQGIFGQSASSQSNMVMQPAPITNPFGALPAMPQMSIGHVGSSPSIQYGISSMPVAERPIQVRTSSLLVPRHLSQRRIRLPPRKYNPKTDGLRVPFFTEDEETSSTPKADALFIPRENPRSLFIRPIEQWPERDQNNLKDASYLPIGNGKVSEPSAPTINEFDAAGNGSKPTENGFNKEQGDKLLSRYSEKTNGYHAQKETDPKYINLSGQRVGDSAFVTEHVTDIEALMPKLPHAEYYTEPSIQELAAKERAEPGFCGHIKDFVVGRRGYGSIKFYGETDVRKLDLESIIQFNNREVIVYTNESKKPPVGQGLNKPAEVTLLNIKCINKKTGQQYTEGIVVDKYKDMLIKKAQEQGAEFISYDPVKGEWKFKVNHFSCYEFEDVDINI